MRNYFAIYDVETGGLKNSENPITQIAITFVDPVSFVVMETYSNFIKPYDNLVITQAALDRSRVTMDQINSGITADQLLVDLVTLFKKYSSKGGSVPVRPVLVGHNVGFDNGFLNYLFERRAKKMYEFVDKVSYDTLRMIKDFETNIKNSDQFSNKLDIVCARYGITLKSAHGAEADVAATLEIFAMMMKAFRSSQKTLNGTKLTQPDNKDKPSAQSTKGRKFFELP